jgi:hypothetical protein
MAQTWIWNWVPIHRVFVYAMSGHSRYARTAFSSSSNSTFSCSISAYPFPSILNHSQPSLNGCWLHNGGWPRHGIGYELGGGWPDMEMDMELGAPFIASLSYAMSGHSRYARTTFSSASNSTFSCSISAVPGSRRYSTIPNLRSMGILTETCQPQNNPISNNTSHIELAQLPLPNRYNRSRAKRKPRTSGAFSLF